MAKRKHLITGFAAAPAKEVNRGAANLYKETVFDQFMGMMGRIPDPDEVLKKVGIKREQLRQLESDDDLSSAMDTRREAVLGMPWRLEPNNSEQVEWLETNLRPKMEQILRCCLQAVPFGYSVGEIIYEQLENGRIGIKSVVEKPFEWFAPQPDGSLVWYSQTAPQGEVVEPIKFMLTVRQPTYRNPYGEALFSRLYWPWFFRKNGWMFWAKWLERFGQPFLLGKTKGNFEEMAAALQKAVQGAALAIHIEDDIKSIDSTGTGQQFVEFEQHVIKRYQRSILGQTLTSDVGDSGSYAAAKVHNEVREDKRNADIRMCVSSLQKLVDHVWLLNGWGDIPPEFIMADDTGLELDRAERDAKLVQAGILRLTEEYLIDRYDFRDGDFVLDEPQSVAPQQVPPSGESPIAEKQPPFGDEPATPTKQGFSFAAKPSRFTKGQQAVEELVANTLSELGPALTQAAILRCIRLSTSPDDLIERLALLFDEDQGEQFTTVLSQAMFAAELMGYAHAQDDEKKASPAPVINVNAQFEAPPAPSVVVNVPEQPAPVVNVNVPEQPAPVVNVTAEAATPVVNVTAAVTTRPTETIIERDADGNIVKAMQRDVPDERTLN